MDRKLDILLVEDDPDDCNAMSSAIEEAGEDFNLLSITNSAVTALKIFNDESPDVIILDLELSLGQGTGFDVLEGIQKAHAPYPPYIVITTNNISSVTHAMVRRFGGDFIFTKTQTGYNASAVINFLRSAKHAILNRRPADTSNSPLSERITMRSQNIKRSISNYLLKVGISPKNKGFNYLLDAIYLVVNECNTPFIYILAENYNKTPASVERAMQNAINRTWATENVDDLLANYTAKITSAKGVPTIGEFVYYYAHKIMV